MDEFTKDALVNAKTGEGVFTVHDVRTFAAAPPGRKSAMEALYGDKPIAACHRCGNCILWTHDQTDGQRGVCEVTAPYSFRGVAVENETGACVTTADSYCDAQVPIPPEGPPCPKCGAPTVDGFGLAGGGYGPYTYCENDKCDYFDKTHLPDDMS